MAEVWDKSWAQNVPQTFGAGPSDPIRLQDQPGTWVQVDVAASIGQLWDIVTDIDLPARFSDEFLGATWISEHPGLGASFLGRSRHPSIGEWEVKSFVDFYKEGQSFGWVTVDRANPGSRWRYDLSPSGELVQLRYSMSIGPGPSGISLAIEAMPEQEPRILRRRILEHHANMMRTVEGIKAMAEEAE